MHTSCPKILVLGHTGMLGNAVTSYFKSVPNAFVYTTNIRFGDDRFFDEIKSLKPDFIINCIGKIPQRKPMSDNEYFEINEALPRFLDELGIPILHPTTDCEWSGNINQGQKYSKDDVRDASDAYGSSKLRTSTWIKHDAANTKALRVSIIGIEKDTSVSLLSWFLSCDISVNGYANHFWNGITTLEWAKQADTIIHTWKSADRITQLGTNEVYSKYQLLNLFKNIFGKAININEVFASANANKCLVSDYPISDLAAQLHELKDFYKM